MSRAGTWKTVVLVLLFLAGIAAVVLSIVGAREALPVSHVERAAVSVSEAPHTVNINTATEAELQTLSGIGEVLAARIVAYRAEHGGFHNVGELLEVEGIGDKLFESMEPHIFCE